MTPYGRINANINEILQSVNPMHVTEYDWLIQNLHRAAEPDYQRRYKNYWRMNGAGLSQQFCQEYFRHLKEANNNMPQLGILVTQLYEIPIRPNRHSLQFSFCTKLCHMLDRHLPIYDSKIRSFYNFKTPNYSLSVKQRILQFVEFHQYLVTEYNRVLHEGLLNNSIQAFRQRLNPEHFTDIKVIDSLIWASPQEKDGNRVIRRKYQRTSRSTMSPKKQTHGELFVSKEPAMDIISAIELIKDKFTHMNGPVSIPNLDSLVKSHAVCMR